MCVCLRACVCVCVCVFMRASFGFRVYALLRALLCQGKPRQ